MGVFALGPNLELFRACAIAAAHELGVFAALPGDPHAIADRIGISRGRHRVRVLLDALVACGCVAVEDERYVLRAVPPRTEVIREGWGTLADVIRSDRPLAIADPVPYHAHLLRAGKPTADELIARVVGPAAMLLDLGGGAGAYTAAFLSANPAGRATLVDAPDILALARDHLAAFGDRVTLSAGDARGFVGPRHDVALLANLLHLHGPVACAELCAAAARAVSPGGTVAVLDLRADSPEGVWFALDMALYTDEGDVHPTHQLRRWLSAAGLSDLAEHALPGTPEVVVVTGRAPGVH